MDFALDIDGEGRPVVSLGAADELKNAVLLSLHVQRGSFFLNSNFGSRLHEIRTLSTGDIATARQYALECLEWMKAIGIVNDISVSASPVRGSRLNLYITLIFTARANITYETFFEVV
jgi:phage gp46-like protein